MRVINSENKNDIIGQYIIFTHVLDEQIKIYGRTKEAAENTISICQDDGVLKEYLEGLKKEVVSTMMLLFDQDYATAMYGKEQEKIGEKKGERKGKRIGAIETTVRMCRRFGATIEEAVNMLIEDFGLTSEKASMYVNNLWQS
ncbi:MAG: hypothetical protein IJQ15_01240 [Synergistaceae bacterium]|nr:hypothetical protein [Synergistaceae bacterium]MBQ6981033.1 hypothetical protein [Synergistaceae bacterium]